MAAQEPVIAYDPSLPKFALIAATTSDRALGYQNDLPWKDSPIPTDMKFFELATQYVSLEQQQLFPPPTPAEDLETSPKNVIIMGRLTWESMPKSILPFINRHTIVVTRNPNLELKMKHEHRRSQTSIVTSLTDALKLSAALIAKSSGSVFVCGGSYLYSESVVHPNCDKFIITEIFEHPPFPADTFFPEYRSILADKANRWDSGANLTVPVVTWLNTFPVSPRRPPIVSPSDIKTGAEGEPFVSENGTSYRFMVYSREITE